MSAAEIRKLDDAARQKRLLELLREQFNLRMNQATGQTGNPHRFKEVRREIARIRTVIHEDKAKQAKADK